MRPHSTLFTVPPLKFLLTHLSRGATRTAPPFQGHEAISTHAPLARCDWPEGPRSIRRPISTHAPLARCDTVREHRMLRRIISTHAPLARCDDHVTVINGSISKFLLTHLSRGATHVRYTIFCDAHTFLLTHLSRGATLFGTALIMRPDISTHAPLARCDAARVQYPA